MLIKVFADDAALYSVVTSYADNRAQFSLNRAVDWAEVWKMIFNIIKCRHLHIGKNSLTLHKQWSQMASKLNWKKLKMKKTKVSLLTKI